MGFSGNLWSCLKEVEPIVVYDVEKEMDMQQKQGNRASSRVDLGYSKLFFIPAVTQCPSRFVTGFQGTLKSSIKEMKIAYMFDGEHAIVLQALKGNWASSRWEGEVSCIFSSCPGNLGFVLELRRDGHSKLVYVQ